MHRDSPLPPLFKFVLGGDKGFTYSIRLKVGCSSLPSLERKHSRMGLSDQTDGDRARESNK